MANIKRQKGVANKIKSKYFERDKSNIIGLTSVKYVVERKK